MRKILSVILILVVTVSNIYFFSYAEDSTQSAEPSQTTQSSENSNRKKNAASSAEPAEEKTDSSNSDEAKDNVDATTDSDDNKENTTEKNENSDSTDLPDVKADAAILVNSNTGMVLYEKNSNKQMYPASTTKIMTAYIALNRLDLTSQITASKTAVSIASDSSKMGLLEGETLTAEELLYALMVQSANDAANVLAEAVSG